MAILLFYYKILYGNFTLLVSSYSLYKQLLSVEKSLSEHKRISEFSQLFHSSPSL